MAMPQVNYLAVLVCGIAVFMLGGLWYSPALFAKRWMSLQGKTEEELKAEAASASMPLMYLSAFICGVVVAFVLAVILNHFGDLTPLRAILVGLGCWLGLAGATSYATALFSGKPKQLWLIDSGYNLVSFVVVALILSFWH